jgi:hypothetical protein
MPNEAAWKLYERYLEGWKAISAEERNKIAAEVLADDVQIFHPSSRVRRAPDCH